MTDASEYARQIDEQVKKNRQLIQDTKDLIEQMRQLFKSLGADLDSGRNIFLESPYLTPEMRKETTKCIREIEKGLKANYNKCQRELKQPLSPKEATEAEKDASEQPLTYQPRRHKMRI